MKRKRSPLAWLIPAAVAVLAAVFIAILTRPPSGRPLEVPGPPASPARTEKPRAPAPARPEPPGPMAAIIIDDIGYSLEAVENAYAVGCPLTVAILPDADLTEETARLAAACGLEIMLHLPLEANGERAGGPPLEGTIRAGMSDAEIRAAVERALARVPGARGVNNHEGSAATESAERIRPVLEVLRDRGLYFIDSRTTAGSVAREAAGKMGVRAASRQVFLDAEPGEAAIAGKLRELVRLAGENGRAVGICHPKRESLAALAREIGRGGADGVRLVFASAVVE